MKLFKTAACFFYFIVGFLLSFSSPVHADPLDNWQWRSPLPQGNSLNAVALNSDIIVAVGATGTIITSLDGVSWTVRSTPTSKDLTGIAYGHNTFVAVGDSGTILTSPDGISWTGQTAPASGTGFTGIAYGNNTFVVVGSFSKGAITSSDGMTWSFNSFWSAEINFSRITFSNNAFFAAGWKNCSGWCSSSPGAPPDVYSSPDGIAWTGPGSSYPFLAGDGYGAVYGNGIYLKMSEPWTDSVKVSADAVTWTEVYLPGPTFDLVKKIYFINECFYVFGDFGYITTSTDGVNWTLITSKNSQPIQPIREATFGNGIWAAVGENIIYSSTDGIAWMPQYSADDNLYDLSGIAYGNNTFVAVGLYHAVLTSPDGRDWTKTALGVELGDVVYGNGIFVGLSGSNLLTSSDGINWTTRASYPPKQYTGTRFYHIVFGNGIFAAIGSDSEQYKDVVYTSPDGESWTAHILDTGTWYYVINDICYGNNTFLIVGNMGYVYSSSDGADWSVRQAGAPTPEGGISFDDRYGVAYGDGVFVSVGETNIRGDIMSSPDGITWTRRKGMASNELKYIAYVNHSFMASSIWGDILQSDRYDTPTPDQFAFTDQANVGLSTVLTSNTITVSGLNAVAPISVIDGTYSLNGGPYTAAGGTVTNGDTVTVRQTSSVSYSTTMNSTLTIGGVYDTFSVTTEESPISLSISKSETGSGTIVSTPAGINCGKDCKENYDSNTSVTLTAQPDAGSAFAGWSGGICSGTEACTFQVGGRKSVTANFIDSYGNINNDGAATLMDAILALQITTGMKTAVELNSGADVNNDNKIGLAETIYILQKAAGIR